jgi:hypothetical protein
MILVIESIETQAYEKKNKKRKQEREDEKGW